MKREVGWHALVVGLGVLLGAAALLTTVEEESAVAPVFRLAVDIGLGVVACLVLLGRRRWPVAVAVAVIAMGVLSSSAFGPTFIAVFGVALRRSWKAIAVVTGLHVAPVLLLWLSELTTRQYVESVVFVGLIDATLVTTGLLLQSQRERQRQAEEGHRLRIEEARRDERERIAREMHDVLAHRISLLAVHAGALEFRPDAPPEQLATAARVIRSSAFEALEELREVIGVLRDDETDPQRPQPTLADLPDLVAQARTGTTVELSSGIEDLAVVPAGIGRHAYRIVQEGLTNARKHAPGERVRVAVRGKPGGELTVELRNRVPGTNGAPIPGAGAGLVGLRERAELGGGLLEHGRTGNGDFRLWASLPWPA